MGVRTTRLYRPRRQHASPAAARVHRIPPRVRDVRTPLLSGGTVESYADLVFGKSEIFLISRLDMISEKQK
jgi:hypothetical protein